MALLSLNTFSNILCYPRTVNWLTTPFMVCIYINFLKVRFLYTRVNTFVAYVLLLGLKIQLVADKVVVIRAVGY